MGAIDEKADPVAICALKHSRQQRLSWPDIFVQLGLKLSLKPTPPAKKKHRGPLRRVQLHDQLNEREQGKDLDQG